MCVPRLLLHVAATQLLWPSSDAATRSTTLLDHHARARSHHSRQWNCLGLKVFVATWFLCNLTTTCKHLNESELGTLFLTKFLEKYSNLNHLRLIFKMTLLTCLRIAFGSSKHCGDSFGRGGNDAFGTKSCHGWKLLGVSTVGRLWLYQFVRSWGTKQFQQRKGLKLFFFVEVVFDKAKVPFGRKSLENMARALRQNTLFVKSYWESPFALRRFLSQ